MPHTSRDAWKRVGVSKKLVQQIDLIVGWNRYPEGFWHNRDHSVIEAGKKDTKEWERERPKVESN